MLEFRPNFVLIIIEFKYHSQKSKNVPNDIRRSFMGLEKASPNIPQYIKNKMNLKSEIFYPIYFSLIKKPVKINLPEINKFKIRNTAVGAMILYEYLGSIQDLSNTIKNLDDFIRNLLESKVPKYFEYCKNYQIIIGRDYKNV